MINSYKDLLVWQKSVRLCKEIYVLSGKYPKHELYGLTSQIRRAVISIPSNIAEGRCRGTKKDFIQFLRIALGSSAELKTQIIISELLEYINSSDAIEINDKIEEISKMLTSMIKKLTADS